MIFLPEARIAVTTFVCVFLLSDALFSSSRTPARSAVCALATALAGYALVGCWQTWAVVAAAAAGAIVAIAGLIGSRSVARRPDSTTRWLSHRLATSLAIIAAVLVSFSLLSENPYTLIQTTGPVIYAALVFVTGAIVVVASGSSFMAAAIRPFAEQLRQRAGGSSAHIEPTDGFIAGGRTIGRYERLLVYVLVMTNAPTAIGFLIAAKSVFRFGDVTDSGNRQKAEYILLGTLMSFTFAIVVSLIARTILEWY